MNRKISQTEYKNLMTFCKKKGVDFLDLRLEVSDHLANAVESLWEEDEKLDFESALLQEYKKFGIFGFTDVVAEYSNRMMNKYGMLFLRELKTMFSLKICIAFIMGGLVLWQLVSTVPQSHIFIQYGAWAFIAGAPLWLTMRYLKIKRVIKGDQLLLLNSPYQYSLWFNYFFIYGGYRIFEVEKMSGNWSAEIVTGVFLITAIFYLISFRLQMKTKQEVLLIKEKVNQVLMA